MTQLRPYQIELINATRTKMAMHNSIIAQAPTGAGKSKIFIAIAKMAAQSGTTTLIISEATKIFQQIASEYPAQLINASTRMTYISKGATYIAMAQTLARRKQLIEQFASIGGRLLIINDEAHIGTATTLLKQMPEAYLIGFTATPAWKWAKHLSDLYKDIVCGPQVGELIQMGFLTPYQHFARVAADMDVLKVEKGEFTEESQQIAFESEKVYDTLTEDLRTIAFRKCIVFTSSIHHCESLYNALRLRGIRVVRSHSNLSASENSYFMKEFTTIGSGVDVCVSVGTLTKGFDFPPIDLVVLMRATTSLPLYLQMVGRGSRIYEGKKLFTVLDYGNNYKRHSLWSDDREWESLWQPSKTKSRDAVAPVKNCPQCEFILRASAMVCTNCGHLFEKRKAAAEIETKLINVTELIKGKRIGDLSPDALAELAKNNIAKKSYAIRVAKAKEQESPGFLAEFAKHMGYRPQWIDHQVIPLEPITFYNKQF